MNQERAVAGWRVVLSLEARRLWLGWRGPALLLAFSVLLSAYVLMLSSDPEINVLSQRTMIAQVVRAAMLVGIVVVLLLGADSFSGERDQRTLEGLLLTPVPIRQLVVGKLLAIVTVWIGIAVLAAPYVVVVARGSEVVILSLATLAVPGTLLVLLSASLGVLISGLSRTNIVSLATSIVAVLFLAAPTQLPGSVKDIAFVHWLAMVDPISAAADYQTAVIEGQAWTSGLELLIGPVVALIVVMGLGTVFLDRRLALDGGIRR